MSAPAPKRHLMASLVWAALPLMVAAWLRWRNLGQLEPFVDEGANVLCALDPRVHAAFQPLEQGRPLLSWMFAPAGWVPGQVLLCARLMASAAGLATMGALGWSLLRLGGRTAALWGLWLWALQPIAVWHERLALQDPFVTAAVAWALALLVAGQHGEGRWRSVPWLGAGLLFGIAVLTKISAVLALPWLGLFYVGTRRQFGLPMADRRLAFLAAGGAIPLLALGSDLPRLGSRLGDYHALPNLTEQHVTAGVMQRFDVWLGWYTGYGGWPLLGLLVLAIIFAGWLPRPKTGIWCAAAGWAVTIPLGSFLFNNGYARYALPDHLPLILFLSLALAAAMRIKGWWVTLAAGLIAFARWGQVDWEIGRDPAQAPVPPADVAQYVTGPWSGRGTAEVRRYLDDYADRHHVQCLVLTHHALRPGCYALMLAELGDARLGVVPETIYEPAELAAMLPGLRRAAAGRPVAWFILYEGSLYPAHPWLDRPGGQTQLVKSVDRGGGESFRLYQFQP